MGIQACIAVHESNGLGIITALILNDINPLGKTRMDLVLELKNNASKLLLGKFRIHALLLFSELLCLSHVCSNLELGVFSIS